MLTNRDESKWHGYYFKRNISQIIVVVDKSYIVNENYANWRNW